MTKHISFSIHFIFIIYMQPLYISVDNIMILARLKSGLASKQHTLFKMKLVV